jgi:hypothetical protein
MIPVTLKQFEKQKKKMRKTDENLKINANYTKFEESNDRRQSLAI